MAESKLLGKTLTKGSDMFPDIHCDPCHDMEGHILQAAGFCENCDENLCQNCVLAHKKNKLTRNHVIKNKKAGVPHTPSIKEKKHATAKCHQHEEEELRSYCRSCDQLCCIICQAIDHQSCNMQTITNAAANIKNSNQLKDLEKKLKALKTGYKDNLSKSEIQALQIEKFYTEAINDMKKLHEKFEKLFTETVHEAVTLRDDDLKKTESISTTSNIIVEQINKMSSNLDQMQNNADNDILFISMKRAESQLNSFEDRLNQLDIDNTIQQYKFKPNENLNNMLDGLKTLGEISFTKRTSSAQMVKTPVVPVPMQKSPVFIKDIDTQSLNIRGSILLPNQQLLLTDMSSCKVKLIDTKQNKIVSELKLPDSLWDVTQVKTYEFAIARYSAKKIQFVSLYFDHLSKGRELLVNGECMGLEYNDQDGTLIVTFDNPPKVEILNLTGTVIKRFDKDANGAQLFVCPRYVTLSHDKTYIYVTDYDQNAVTLMTLAGDVKAVYKDNTLQGPYGICVHSSGIVYVVGRSSNTVHYILPGSDKLEPTLCQKDGVTTPITISYCDAEDQLFVGQKNTKVIKIFKMK